MKIRFLVFFLILLFLSCKEEEPIKLSSNKIIRELQLSSFFELYDLGVSTQIINRIKQYISLEDFYSENTLKEYWAEENFVYLKLPGYHITPCLSYSNKENVLFLKGIEKITNKEYKVYLSLINKKEGKLLASFYLFVIIKNGTIKFIDPIVKKLESYTKKDSLLNNRIKLISQDKNLIHQNEIDSIVFFIQKMDSFFSHQPSFNIISLRDNDEVERFWGFDYNFHMFHVDKYNAGLADRYNKILFSGNNSFYYPHEIVHFYTKKYKSHQYFDEGIATYFGGSMGVSLDELLKDLSNEIKEDRYDFPDNILYTKPIKLKNSPSRTIGGFLIKLAMEEYGGKETVFKMLNAGKTEADFYYIMQEVFKTSQSEMDTFIIEKLKRNGYYEYKTKE